MKSFITLLLMVCSVWANSQEARKLLLLKEGSRLEYKNYLYAPNLPKNRVAEITRIILTVDSVRETDGVISSYITKKGIAANKPKYNYTSRFILKSDGNRVILPYVLYMVDTTYTCDMDVHGIGGTVLAALNLPQNSMAFLVPPSFTGVHDVSFDKRAAKGKVWTKQINTGRDENIEFIVRNVYVDGHEKITARAGEFDCYKIIMEVEMNAYGRHIIGRFEIYYNETTGIIKSVTDTGYMELTDAREP